MKTQLSTCLKESKNIGATIKKRLNEIGIFSLADLAQMTPIKAYQSICRQNPYKTFPIYYYLYTLQGALLDLYWDGLPVELKSALRKQADKKKHIHLLTTLNRHSIIKKNIKHL